MNDFTVRSENVDVEQIMRQIRARIREKRGVDYTEDEIRELANVKLEKFIDPRGVRSGLLDEYRRVSTPEPPAPNFAFGEDTLYETHRGPIRWLRSLFRPVLKLLFFNPNPLIQALHIQAELNTRNADRAARREQLDALHYEVIHNLVVELTRTGVEVKSLTMRLESMASRLDFDERRARALEGVVQYRAGAVPPQQPPANQDQGRRDQGQRDQRPQQSRHDQGRSDQGRRDQGFRNQGPRDQGHRGPGPSIPGPSAPVSSVPDPSVPGSSVAPSSVAPSSVPGSSVPGFSGPSGSGNALDADGNERRARRRRRRGRRRPGDRFGGEGSSAGSAASPSPVGPTFRSGIPEEASSPDLKVGPTGDVGPGSEDSGAPPASAPERTTAGFGEASPAGSGGGSEPESRKEPVPSASARDTDSPKPPGGEGG